MFRCQCYGGIFQHVSAGRYCVPSAQRATHTHSRFEYAAIALATKHINKYAGTMLIILARQ